MSKASWYDREVSENRNSRVVRIHTDVFKRLQNIAVPLEDNINDTLRRLLDKHEKQIREEIHGT